jgi:2-polyprenyl-3-methyl-5-hydroxy-6-metoxy-1,4-benzoquinol methylase
MNCRHCKTTLTRVLVDLGSAPPSNAYLTYQSLHAPEKWYPLRVLMCDNCGLAQTEDFAQASELFDNDYAYFSGFSSSWLAHCERYIAEMVERFHLDKKSHIVEIAANDGSLLQYAQSRGIPCTGVEPTKSTANAARAKGILIIEAFFGVQLAKHMAAQEKAADLIAANNVLAHVPDINDFVSGFAVLLKPNGVATFEFPDLQQLIHQNQFDTIYHEHFSYIDLPAANRILQANGLHIFDVESLSTHGGSLRVYAQRADTGQRQPTQRFMAMLQNQTNVTSTQEKIKTFQATTNNIKNEFLAFLLQAKRDGKTVAAYGAAAKGNTLLNYAGIRPDLIACVADRNPEKQGKYLPGSRIPIVSEEKLHTLRPDYVVILPWNLKTEIMQQLEYIKRWSGRFVTAIPVLEVK